MTNSNQAKDEKINEMMWIKFKDQLTNVQQVVTRSILTKIRVKVIK